MLQHCGSVGHVMPMKGHPSSVFPLFGCQEEWKEVHVADEDLDVQEEELIAARRYERNTEGYQPASLGESLQEMLRTCRAFQPHRQQMVC